MSAGQARRTLALGPLALLLLSASGLAGCGGGRSEKSHPGAPIILISIDTLRSDHLPSYGYRDVETPALSALERDAILFEHAYSHYPLTFPSHCSILTGLLPTEHGVRDNVGYPLAAKDLPYLPRELKAAGYATGAAVSAYVLEGGQGLKESFDVYDDSIELKANVPLGGLQRSGRETLARITPWMERVSSTPFFLFLHLYEPHTPYTPPEPFASRYPLAYDGEIAEADAVIGRLVADLKRLGVYDRAIIVLLSDHGEGLGDHGEFEHGIFLYRESLQVPLMLKLPGQKRGGERVATPAELTDVAPTLLALTGRPVPERMKGIPLTELGPELPGRKIYAETYYPRLHLGWNDLASLIGDGYHYIEGPDPELYQLAGDPAEKSNILLQEKRAFGTLRAALSELRAPLARPGEVDAETVAKLAALGYAGAPTQLTEGVLPDPKTKIHALAEFKEASHLMGGKRFLEALPILEKLVRENPHMQDGWERLAQCQTRLGRRQDAIATYEKALENSGGAAHVALALASLLAEMGQTEEAKKHAELALRSSPGPAHRRLAEIAMGAEDLPEAEKQARAAAAAEPDRPDALVILAMVLNRQSRLEESQEAMGRLEKMIADSRDNLPAGYHLVRGDLLARSGQIAEAERAFREEIRLNPETLETYRRLALLLVADGRGQEAWQALQQMVEGNGNSPAAYVAAVETLRVLGDPATASRLLRHARGLYPRDERLISLERG